MKLKKQIDKSIWIMLDEQLRKQSDYEQLLRQFPQQQSIWSLWTTFDEMYYWLYKERLQK